VFAVFVGVLLILISKRQTQIRLLETEIQSRQTETLKLKIEKETSEGVIKQLQDRFKGILDIDAEIISLNKEKSGLEAKTEQLKSKYKEKKGIFDSLRTELAVYDERLSFGEMGIYEPHFDYQDSETFKDAITDVREELKTMVSEKTAVTCATEWTVDGSRAKGRTKTGRNIRLALRAFNNECDVAIANAKWNNVKAMEKRIANARVQIDKLNASNHITIEAPYFDLKLKELRLTHEYREKKKIEKDERAEAARLAREESKLLKDAALAQKKEDEFQRLLNLARKEIGVATSEELAAASDRVKQLENQLEEAQQRNERAQAMAEKTKSGYVYVISNIGSFGEGVIKIGMTRRLEPHDRVKELGDASVPFLFDTHAMIYSEDAPALEKALHAAYKGHRVNAANSRKEFFRVEVEDVRHTVLNLAPDTEFFTDIEAREFRETIAKRKRHADEQVECETKEFPDEI